MEIHNFNCWHYFPTISLNIEHYFISNFVLHSLPNLPDDRSENSKLTDALNHHDLLPRPNHVVSRDRWFDHVHQYVGVSLVRVLDAFQKWPEKTDDLF